jgi:hypothetical protein
MLVHHGCTYAQQESHNISDPLDFKEAGIRNTVLCMKNGNTLLFHIELDKKLVLKVFDNTHKEIASVKESSRYVNFGSKDYSFLAVYDINDEAVLFVDRDMNSRHTLVRIRFNSHTGAIVDESIVGESKNENRRMRFYLVKHIEDENYEVLFCADNSHPRETDMFIVFFDNHHQSIKEIQLPVDRTKFDGIEVVSAKSRPNGVFVTLSLIKTKIYGVDGSSGPVSERSSNNDHFMQFYYIPFDTKILKTTMVEMSTGVFPKLAYFTYNSFAQSLNLLVHSHAEVKLGSYTGNVKRTLFFKIAEHDLSSIGLMEMRNLHATAYLQAHTDTNRIFNGIPLYTYTDDNGLTTIVSETENHFESRERINDYYSDQYAQNIGITQIDDDGNEIWGTALPLAQFYNSYRSLPIYGRQMMSVRVMRKDKDFYIAYNDYDKNFTNSIEKPGDTVYNFNLTNACYYKLDKKKELTKHYLFGESAADEYKTSFIHGSGYDELRGVFASMIQYRKGDEISFRMAWSRFE